MKIKFYGNSCFNIVDGGFSVVTDPNDKLQESLKADVVTISQDDSKHNNKAAVAGEPKVLNWPGEYEVSGVHIQGIASFHNPKDAKEQKENTIFMCNINGIDVCHLGGLGTKLTPEQLEQIPVADHLGIKRPHAGVGTGPEMLFNRLPPQFGVLGPLLLRLVSRVGQNHFHA